MKLALNENTIPQTDFINFVNLAAKAGFTAIEPNIRKLEEVLLCYSFQKISKFVCDCGLSLLPVNYFNPFYTPSVNRKFLRKQCETIGSICELLDCSNILVPSGTWLPSLEKQPKWIESFDLQKENLIFISQIFSKFGVSLAIEPVGRNDFSFSKLSEADKLIQESGIKDIGIVTDVHLQMCSNDTPEDLKKMKSPITLMHLNDTDRTAQKPFNIHSDRTFPGEGIAETHEWVKAALSKGYKGYYIFKL